MSKLSLSGTKRQRTSEYDLSQTEALFRLFSKDLENLKLCLCEVVPLFHTSTRSLFKRTEDEYIPDAESVRQAKEQHQQPQTCSLAQCFQLYTKEEQVKSSDASVKKDLVCLDQFEIVPFVPADCSSLPMTRGAVLTASSFSRAASS